MKLKLDENLGPSAGQVLQEAGHDVSTVVEQDLCGATDDRLATIVGRLTDACGAGVFLTNDRRLPEVGGMRVLQLAEWL